MSTIETSWRDLAIARIAAVLIEYEVTQQRSVNPTIEWKQLRRYLSDRYPFGERRYTPYNVWCEEVKRVQSFLQTGWELRLYTTWRDRHVGRVKRTDAPVKGQISLF